MFERTEEYMSENELGIILLRKPENLFYFSEFTPIAGGYVLIHPEESKLLVPELEYDAAQRESNLTVELIDDFNDVSKILEDFDRVGAESDFPLHLSKSLENVTDLVDISDHISDLRKIKSDEEINKIKKASQLSVEAMKKGIESIKRGKKEYEVAAEIEYKMKSNGADTAFDTIVASGERSSLPHGVASEKKIGDGPVTMDLGAKLNNYCSDITRTVLMNPSEKMEEIYEIVLEAQKKAVEAAKPGMKAKKLDKVARDIIKEYGYGDRFYHTLGHGVGLEVHETPKISEDSEKELKPGMIITIEPGIYIKNEGGVRIEDTVLITDDGVERLTKMKRDLR